MTSRPTNTPHSAITPGMSTPVRGGSRSVWIPRLAVLGALGLAASMPGCAAHSDFESAGEYDEGYDEEYELDGGADATDGGDDGGTGLDEFDEFGEGGGLLGGGETGR